MVSSKRVNLTLWWIPLVQAGVIAVEAGGYGDWLSAISASQQTYLGTPVSTSKLMFAR
jgi:hypothetical protein